MNRYFVLLFVFCISDLINAQNLLHYAMTSNGEKGECLFPENTNGEVYFSDILEAPYSADTIMTVINDYITSRSVSDKCVVKCLSNSSRTSTYSIQLNIGKQMWGIEYFSSPLFVRLKDASHVKFKCIIEARSGKYKYTLMNFETNRNTIRGEAKNDGQPNVIHWQRINSLTKERNAFVATHDIKKRSVKEDLFDFNSQIAYEATLYRAEYEAVKSFEYGLRNQEFKDDFMSVNPKANRPEEALSGKAQGRVFSISMFGDGFFTQAGSEKISSVDNKISKPIDLEHYKGFLMDIGNNVYVTSGAPTYEQAGAQEIIKQIIIDGYWHVVENIEDAHFIVEYHVNLEGRDKAYILLKVPNSNIVCNNISGGSKGSSESYRENKEVARSIYLNALAPLAKKIQQKNYPKNLQAFNRQ